MHRNNTFFIQSLTVLILSFTGIHFSFSQSVRGTVTDAKTQETLPGVNIIAKNTAKGTVSQIDGCYQLELPAGRYTIVASCISYATLEVADVAITSGQPVVLNLALKESVGSLDEVVVAARRNMETEQALMSERQHASAAAAYMGAKEMSIKGLSTVAEGIKKITGVSMQGNSHVYVRGLGDRYSMTSLNGFPIASPNPDHKLIPLTLFPASVVRNISVSKVFRPSVYGDYSGAHINVDTKENTGNDYVSLSITTGGKINTLFAAFYRSDKGSGGSFLRGIGKQMNLPDHIKQMHTGDFEAYQRNHPPFKTGFSIRKQQGLPETGIDFGAGKTWPLSAGRLNTLFAVNFNNEYTRINKAYMAAVNAQGVVRDQYDYDKYSYETAATLLARINYAFRVNDMLSYHVMLVNHTEDNYMQRDGFDAEGIELKGSNSVYHIYSLLNHQWSGRHHFRKEKLTACWQLSYGETSGNEPDRRQVMFSKNEDGTLSLFKLNRQETMRYFGELNEDEWNGDVRFKYALNRKDRPDFIHAGLSLREKARRFYSSAFYYNLKNISPEITGIYETDHFLNQEHIQNGAITIDKNSQPRNKYNAGSDIYAVFAEVEYNPAPYFSGSAGVRYENAEQRVRYWTDAAEEKRTVLRTGDFFPAVNLKYTAGKSRNFRLSLSRTVTRPSFIEMAPFEYRESYGGAIVRGNAAIQNGYNYNVDIRYEAFRGFGNMFSAGLYYKYLDAPIERVQEYAGSLIQSFRNVDEGHAAGAEIEFRRNLNRHFKLDFNASCIFTHISLSGNGIYTDKSRQLQGASPFLANIDLNYNSAPAPDHKALSLSAVYNLQGPRIHSAGINGVSNVMEETYHTLHVTGSFSITGKVKLKFQGKNLTGGKQKFTQKIKATGKNEVVGYSKEGLSVQAGFSVDF
ncbi:MAG: TonB-dependent receptor [Tannerella sp.]|jgi:outer membrane receptor protein involved in Fe transport|nr:TonB-dependent receptor [Tannerella sp.]